MKSPAKPYEGSVLALVGFLVVMGFGLLLGRQMIPVAFIAGTVATGIQAMGAWLAS